MLIKSLIARSGERLRSCTQTKPPAEPAASPTPAVEGMQEKLIRRKKSRPLLQKIEGTSRSRSRGARTCVRASDEGRRSVETDRTLERVNSATQCTELPSG